jgi:peptidoglycan/xylan/chitin deacetylase (PgdA/CDA1 family)
MIPVLPPAWDAVERELDLWKRSGLQARFWWRDDDASGNGPPLDRLLDLRRSLDLPLAIAAIPAGATPGLADRLAGETRVHVLQHGWDHRNHAPDGRPKAELARSRDEREVERDLAAGQCRMRELFAERALPVLVPPYNFLAPRLAKVVRRLGFRYVSLLGDFQPLAMPSRNVHVDVVDWRSGKAEQSKAIALQAITALRLRRFGFVERLLPVGIMTHHLQHDEEAWQSSEALLAGLRRHAAASFPPIDAVFAS